MHLPMQEMQQMWICSLGQEDPLEEEMAVQSSVSCLENPMAEEPGGLQPTPLQRVRHDWVPERTQ